MTYTIVVPCYNEEAVLNEYYTETTAVLKQHCISYELLFINDGSSDQTLSILQELSKRDQQVKYISFSKNFGKEAAMLAGITYSKGEGVIIMDADLQHPPSLIPNMIAKHKEGYDQVIAKRDRTGDSASRTFMTRLYYKYINRLIDVELEDGVGDFRLLSRPAIDALLQLQEYNRFSKGLFSWIGFSEYIISYENVTREIGDSKWSFKSLLNYGIDGVISFNNKPLRIAIYLGLTLTAASLLYVFGMLLNIAFTGIDVPGYFTTIAAILLLGGIQLFFLGVIGEYIGRIYYESKKRPHFIIQHTNIHPNQSNKE